MRDTQVERLPRPPRPMTVSAGSVKTVPPPRPRTVPAPSPAPPPQTVSPTVTPQAPPPPPRQVPAGTSDFGPAPPPAGPPAPTGDTQVEDGYAVADGAGLPGPSTSKWFWVVLLVAAAIFLLRR